MFEYCKKAPPVEDERPFRLLQLKEIDEDIKDSIKSLANFYSQAGVYSYELYPMMIQLQVLRQLNKLTKQIDELIKQSKDRSNSINHGSDSDDNV